MKQINGPGSIVMIVAFLLAALAAEYIPAMLAFVAVGIGGFAWDRLHGNFGK